MRSLITGVVLASMAVITVSGIAAHRQHRDEPVKTSREVIAETLKQIEAAEADTIAVKKETTAAAALAAAAAKEGKN